jgi:hypothetical protein
MQNDGDFVDVMLLHCVRILANIAILIRKIITTRTKFGDISGRFEYILSMYIVK